jgi:hypothetical protein
MWQWRGGTGSTINPYGGTSSCAGAGEADEDKEKSTQAATPAHASEARHGVGTPSRGEEIHPRRLAQGWLAGNDRPSRSR